MHYITRIKKIHSIQLTSNIKLSFSHQREIIEMHKTGSGKCKAST